MSRYLKADPGTVFRGKKVFSSSGGQTFTFPSTASTAKVMVFGGGGNSCSSVTFCTSSCCCCSSDCRICIFNHSGAGGGYTEKTFTSVGGCTSCIVVGAAEGTSSFCIPSAGTITATGGSSTALGCCNPPRCTAFGVGSCGDINKCGSLGACQYSSFCCGCCYAGSVMSCAYVLIPGGAPGNTVQNGCVPALTTNLAFCLCNCLRYANPSPYGTNCCSCCSTFYKVYCDLARGYGACPLETDRYYAYDWDIVGGASCSTAGNPTSTILTLTQSANCSCSCCNYSGCCLVNTVGIPTAYPTGVAGGLAGSGGAGAVGGIGGGGGGVLNTCITPRDVTSGYSGGSGLVVIYY